jgi:hypothetical protein
MIRFFADPCTSRARDCRCQVIMALGRSRARSLYATVRKGARLDGTIGAVATCAHCGGDRLIRLSFGVAQPDDGGQPDGADQPERPDIPDRPIMKCLACGDQLYADDVVGSPTDSD